MKPADPSVQKLIGDLVNLADTPQMCVEGKSKEDQHN